MSKNKKVVIYQAKNGAIELKGDFKRETLWANQAQIVDLFGVDQSVVSRHIRNIFKDGEVDEKSNMQKMHIANSDKPVSFYSLDVVLAVGYRTNSKVAISFRQWATKTLRSHIVEGYTVNPSRITENYEAFMKAVDDVKKLAVGKSSVKTDQVLELVKAFAGTWFSLDAYDKSDLPKKGASKKHVEITSNELMEAIIELKKDLITKREATDLFAQEKKKDALAGIVGNVFQAFGGEDLYSTLEEKAAHLLYFIVKNHPFNDGNKRSGAFAFVWFLQRVKVLNKQKMTPETLTALTLLIAESNPKEKGRILGLVLLLIS